VNLLDAAECAVTIGNSGQALIHLEDAEALLMAVNNKTLPAPLEGGKRWKGIFEKQHLKWAHFVQIRMTSLSTMRKLRYKVIMI